MRKARLEVVGGGWGGWGRFVPVLAAACIATASTTCTTSTDFHRPSFYDPAHDLGSLFQAVQLSGIFPDSKTFVDARPLFPPSVIAARYDSARTVAGFDLRAFVERQFQQPQPVGAGVAPGVSRSRTMEDHIRALWPVLTRPPDTADARSPRSDAERGSSLIPLPHPYVVPGGRFREIYY